MAEPTCQPGHHIINIIEQIVDVGILMEECSNQLNTAYLKRQRVQSHVQGNMSGCFQSSINIVVAVKLDENLDGLASLQHLIARWNEIKLSFPSKLAYETAKEELKTTLEEAKKQSILADKLMDQYVPLILQHVPSVKFALFIL